MSLVHVDGSSLSLCKWCRFRQVLHTTLCSTVRRWMFLNVLLYKFLSSGSRPSCFLFRKGSSVHVNSSIVMHSFYITYTRSLTLTSVNISTIHFSPDLYQICSTVYNHLAVKHLCMFKTIYHCEEAFFFFFGKFNCEESTACKMLLQTLTIQLSEKQTNNRLKPFLYGTLCKIICNKLRHNIIEISAVHLFSK